MDSVLGHVQTVPPGHFGAAPLGIGAEQSVAAQFRIPGIEEWSDRVPLMDQQLGGLPVVLPAQPMTLRFQAHILRHDQPTVTSIHLTAPWRLVNATPLRLCFRFDLPPREGVGDPVDVMVEAFSTAMLPASLDGTKPYRLALAADASEVSFGTPSSSLRSEAELFLPNVAAPSLQRVFQQDSPRADLNVAMPDGSTFRAAITPGLSCRVACRSWLVDRTGLGLRVLASARRPTPSAPALPSASGLHLLDCCVNSAFSKIYLAMPSRNDHEWALLAKVKLPSGRGSVSHVALTHPALAGTVTAQDYPAHVCLQVDDASQDVTFGAATQVISVMPQVIIYNETDVTLKLRAADDSKTEVVVRSQEDGAPGTYCFLRWRTTSTTKDGRSRLSLQFRPANLEGAVDWSVAVCMDETTQKPLPLALQASRAGRRQAVAIGLCLFTAHVVENNGVVSLRVLRGAKQELQNWSCLVNSVLLRRVPLDSDSGGRVSLQHVADAAPTNAATAARPVQAMSHRGSSVGFGTSDCQTFVAKTCENVEFAWPCAGDEGMVLELQLTWTCKAVPGRKIQQTCVTVPPLNRPGGTVVCRAPGGWQAVVVNTGITGDTRWIRIRDFLSVAGRELAAVVHGKLPQFSLTVSLPNIGLSVISSAREQELLYAELRQLHATLLVEEDLQSFELVVSEAQVDCQLLDYRHVPVVFANRGERGMPCLSVRSLQPLPAPLQTSWLSNLSLQVDDFEATVSDEFITEVLQTVSDAAGSLLAAEGVSRSQLVRWQTEPLSGGFELPPPSQSNLCIDELAFSGLSVTVWAHYDLRPLRPSIRKPLRILTLGGTDLTIDGARLALAPHVFRDVRAVGSEITGRYWPSFVSVAGSILRRSTLLEIPAWPIVNCCRGAAYVMRAADFLLVRVSDVVALATFDQEYMQRKHQEREQHQEEVLGMKSGLAVAGLHLAEGLWHLGDIVRQPLRGAQRYGAVGFFFGLLRGTLGTTLKPAVEAGLCARALARASYLEGKKVAERLRSARPRRPPRAMYPGGAIREFDEAAALLVLELRRAPVTPGCSPTERRLLESAKLNIREQFLVAQFGATPHTRRSVLVLTQSHFLLVEIDPDVGVTLTWSLNIWDFRSCRASSHGVTIIAEVSLDRAAMRRRTGYMRAERRVEVRYLIPCTEAKVIQTVCRALRPYQSYGVMSAARSH